MTKEFLGDRKKALEESFFAKESEKLRKALKAKEKAKQMKEALSAVSGITDDAVLEEMVEIGIHSDTLAAMSLVPLVEVAWADGKMQADERSAILAAAKDAGLGGESTALLEGWLSTRPGTEVLAAWKDYVAALASTMDRAARDKLKEELLGRARTVAEAAGGFLGVAKISREEEEKLKELARAFS